MLKYGIIENLDTVRRIPVGKFWGVRILVTPITWLGPVVFFGLHAVLTAFRPYPDFTARLSASLFFTLAVEITIILHAFGHILSGKLVRSAMDELLITTTRDVNVYHGGQDGYPGYVHLGRALGGPVFNLIVAAGLMQLPATTPGFWAALLTSLIATNLFFGYGGFLPIPSVDGEVIWRELLKSLRRRLKG